MTMVPSKDAPVKQTHANYKSRFSMPRTLDPLPPPKDFLEGLIDKPLETIDTPDIDPKQEDVLISGYSYIGSYNWVKEDSGTPAILVPGMARTSRTA
jgi:hypothetical protein